MRSAKTRINGLSHMNLENEKPEKKGTAFLNTAHLSNPVSSELNAYAANIRLYRSRKSLLTFILFRSILNRIKNTIINGL